MFIQAPNLDDSGINTSGSKKYHKIKQLKHKLNTFNCQSKIS